VSFTEAELKAMLLSARESMDRIDDRIAGARHWAERDA
jgi:hypothetical protein